MAAKVENLFSVANVSDKRRCEAWLDDRIAKAKKLPASELMHETISVNETWAEVILNRCNIGNRPLSLYKAQKFAEIIKAGAWHLTSQGISFSREGMLNNGQHRLKAVLLSGMPIRTNVTFGEDRSAFAVLDATGKRTASDTLHIEGEQNTAVLAAAARLFLLVASEDRKNRSFPNHVILETVRANPKLSESTVQGCRIGRKLKTSNSAMSAALYLIVHQSKAADKLPTFIQYLFDDTRPINAQAIGVLRDGIMTKKFEPWRESTANGICMMAAVINTWNAWIAGRKVSLSKIRWKDGTFPQPR